MILVTIPNFLQLFTTFFASHRILRKFQLFPTFFPLHFLGDKYNFYIEYYVVPINLNLMMQMRMNHQ